MARAAAGYKTRLEPQDEFPHDPRHELLDPQSRDGAREERIAVGRLHGRDAIGLRQHEQPADAC